MGAVLSIPMLALPAATAVGSWVASFCGAAACTALCKSCGGVGKLVSASSVMTRAMYAFLLILNSIISWVMLSGWAIKKLEGLMRGYLHIRCPHGECYGVLAVERMAFALGSMHLVLALSMIGVRSSRERRASVQNGFWGPKLMLWILLVVVSFVVPNGFFVFWADSVAIPGSVLFILFGLFLLVDCAHSWAETCLQKVEATDSKGWQAVLVGSTVGMYAATIAMTVVLYVFFARDSCSMNQALITINLILCISATVTSIHPRVQECNPSSGIAQSAMVSVYTTYLTLSALANAPQYRMCNPITPSSQTVTTVVGAIFTFAAIAYSTTRAATNTGSAIRLDGPERSLAAASGSGEQQHDLVTSQPSERARMRKAALEAAVESGALPASALSRRHAMFDDENEVEARSVDDDAQDEMGSDMDDERSHVQYNYSMFHVVFFLATCYVAALLSGWSIVRMDGKKNDNGGLDDGPLVVIGRSFAVVWVKALSSWACHALYIWSCVAPVILPERFA